MSTQRTFLLLHGFGNHRPPEHWQHWLAGQLETAGERVLYPQLPDPDSPTLEAWLAALEPELIALAEDIGAPAAQESEERGERIILCHSLACLLWIHAAPFIPEVLRPDRVVLVSPPAPDCIPEPAVGFSFEETIDADALHASVTLDLRIVCSDADEYNPTGAATMFASPLGVPFNEIPGGGHLSASDGYGPWPEMLAWCLDPGGPIRPA